jgi:hypothetical protein
MSFDLEPGADGNNVRTMTSEKTREKRLRRLARKEQRIFHKSRKPFVEGGVRARYYVSDMSNTLVAVYADLDVAEEHIQS